MNCYDWPTLAHSLSKEHGCPVNLAQGCRNPGLPQRLGPPPVPWLRSKVAVDLPRSLSIALHARYHSERSDIHTPEWGVTPLLNGPFKHHASLVDSAVEQEHIGELPNAAVDLPASGARRRGG